MSEAVAPSRAMRSRANRRESSVARGIELDSPSLKSTDLVGLYHVERPRETLCRNFARNFVSRDRGHLSHNIALQIMVELHEESRHGAAALGAFA